VVDLTGFILFHTCGEVVQLSGPSLTTLQSTFDCVHVLHTCGGGGGLVVLDCVRVSMLVET